MTLYNKVFLSASDTTHSGSETTHSVIRPIGSISLLKKETLVYHAPSFQIACQHDILLRAYHCICVSLFPVGIAHGSTGVRHERSGSHLTLCFLFIAVYEQLSVT